jgi:electron transport complex protein RnfD
MVEAPNKTPATPHKKAQEEAAIEPGLQVAPGPHLSSTGLSTRRLMVDVLIALVPVMAMALYLFRWFAVQQLAICVVSCVTAEALTSLWRGSRPSPRDASGLVTGVILGLSLPWSAPWYVGVVASVVAIGFGKAVFGGLGQNIFNPAMVGRAFVMISFASSLGATAYVRSGARLEILTQATPLTAAKELSGSVPGIWTLFVGNANGSLGETSVLACLAGGLYLCLRRSAVWQIPISMLASAAVVAGLANLLMPATPLTVLQHLTSGALVFSAFFIATDPVTSPLTGRGQVIFGAGLGALVVVIRLFSNYPEGVVFAVLLMNAVVPLINRVTIPEPLGGLPVDA